jgi:hypothetical protein
VTQRRAALMVALALLSARPVWAEEAAAAGANAVLAQSPLADLVGTWKMVGHVGSKEVEYRARGKWVLGGAFLRLSMSDVAQPPGYQAEVFIGHDATSERLVCHWLDAFGGRPSETLGYGAFEGESLTLVFEYPPGPFRTTLAREAHGTWRVTMRAKEGQGPWETFAEYTLVRAGSS